MIDSVQQHKCNGPFFILRTVNQTVHDVFSVVKEKSKLHLHLRMLRWRKVTYRLKLLSDLFLKQVKDKIPPITASECFTNLFSDYVWSRMVWEKMNKQTNLFTIRCPKPNLYCWGILKMQILLTFKYILLNVPEIPCSWKWDRFEATVTLTFDLWSYLSNQYILESKWTFLHI